MSDFFANIDPNQQVYWYIAVLATLIFVIQTVLTFVGADADTGLDADFDGNLDGGDFPFQIFSFRNLVNFLLGFGWTGVALYNSIENQVVLSIVSFVVGCLFVAIFFLVMRTFLRLAENNTFDIQDCVNKVADVYMTIPARKQGKGRVMISVKGSTHELPAITYSTESIPNGALVKVLKVEANLLVVEPVK